MINNPYMKCRHYIPGEGGCLECKQCLPAMGGELDTILATVQPDDDEAIHRIMLLRDCILVTEDRLYSPLLDMDADDWDDYARNGVSRSDFYSTKGC